MPVPVHLDVILVLTTYGMTNAQKNHFADQHEFLEIARCMTPDPRWSKT